MKTIYTRQDGIPVIRLGIGNGEIACPAGVTSEQAREIACTRYPLGTPGRKKLIQAALQELTAWKNDAHGINGTENNHYDLARYAECKGFEVEADSDDNCRSLIARPGSEDFGDRVIGEINGDEESVIVITANLD